MASVAPGRRAVSSTVGSAHEAANAPRMRRCTHGGLHVVAPKALHMWLALNPARLSNSSHEFTGADCPPQHSARRWPQHAAHPSEAPNVTQRRCRVRLHIDVHLFYLFLWCACLQTPYRSCSESQLVTVRVCTCDAAGNVHTVLHTAFVSSVMRMLRRSPSPRHPGRAADVDNARGPAEEQACGDAAAWKCVPGRSRPR